MTTAAHPTFNTARDLRQNKSAPKSEQVRARDLVLEKLKTRQPGQNSKEEVRERDLKMHCFNVKKGNMIMKCEYHGFQRVSYKNLDMSLTLMLTKKKKTWIQGRRMIHGKDERDTREHFTERSHSHTRWQMGSRVKMLEARTILDKESTSDEDISSNEHSNELDSQVSEQSNADFG